MATDWNVWGTIKQAAGLWFRKDGYALKVTPTGTTLTADRTINLPNANADTTLATIDGIQTLTNKAIDGGTASANNKLKLPEDTYANLVSLAGKVEGQIFYANDVDKVYYYNDTALIEVGSGSGTGKKNYILNPSAATDVSKWTASNFTVTKDTSTSIPRETTTGTAFKLISTSTSATFLSDAMLLDDTDLSKKLGVELALNITDSSNWTIDILASATAGGTYARLPLSTDVAAVTTLPATVGVFKTSVDMVAATPYIKFRITSAATAKTAYFSDILVTPDGNTVVGPVIEEWKSYTPTFQSGFSLGSLGTHKVTYRRVGDSMELSAYFTVGGTGIDIDGSGSKFTFTIPTGLTINTTNSKSYNRFGFFQGYLAGVNRVLGTVVRDDVSTTTLFLELSTAFNTSSALAQTSPYTVQAGDEWHIKATVPIAEWANSGTVNLAQNDEEYASNSDTSVTANTVAFAYGPSGSSFPSGTAAAAFDKTVRFQGTIQQSDSFIIEINTGLGWRPIDAGPLSSVSRLQYQNGVSYGLDVVDILDSTSIKVRFGKYCFANGATYGANGVEWSSIPASFKWRVRKTSGGRAIGFSHVSENSAGLMPASNTSLDNATATRLGLKAYAHGTNYSGGNAPTITLTSGGGTLSSVTYSSFIPYQLQDGSWRVKTSIVVALSSAARTNPRISINGLTFANAEAGSGFVGAGNSGAQVYSNSASSILDWFYVSTTGTTHQLSGDFSLSSKPTWAY